METESILRSAGSPFFRPRGLKGGPLKKICRFKKKR